MNNKIVSYAFLILGFLIWIGLFFSLGVDRSIITFLLSFAFSLPFILTFILIKVKYYYTLSVNWLIFLGAAIFYFSGNTPGRGIEFFIFIAFWGGLLWLVSIAIALILDYRKNKKK